MNRKTAGKVLIGVSIIGTVVAANMWDSVLPIWGVLVGIGMIFYTPAPSPGQYLCVTCHTVSSPKGKLAGSDVVELFLYLFIIFPGIAYSIWRRTNKIKVCPHCKSEELIPETSPRAKKILGQAPTA